MNLWCNQVHNVPLVFPEIQTNNAATPTINTFGFGPPVLGRTLVGFTAIDTHLQIPRVEQASISFERQLDVDDDGAGRLSRGVGIAASIGRGWSTTRSLGPAACSRAGRTRRSLSSRTPTSARCRRTSRFKA